MATGLKRYLKLWQIVAYGVGLILGAGVYVLIGSTAGIAGNMVWLSFLIAAIVAGFTAMSYAELSTMFPRSGAEYIYAKAAFKLDSLAWMIGFCAVVISFSTASAVAIGFGNYASRYMMVAPQLIALALILLLSLISFRGIKQSTSFNVVATSIEVGGLLLIIFAGAYQIVSGHIPLADLLLVPNVEGGSSTSLLPVISAGALIFFAFMGFEDIANIAEDTVNPAETLPRAFIYSLVIATLIYLLVAIVAVSVIPYAILAKADQPLSLVMERLIGGIAPNLMDFIALFATANTVLITLMVGARMLYGMAQENSLPPKLASIDESRQTPWVAIIVIALLSSLFLGFKDIEVLASISDVGIFLLFFSVNLSNIVLRYKMPATVRPWKAPVNIGAFPVLSGLGAISCVLMLVNINHPVHVLGLSVSSLFVGLVIFASAFPFYWLLGRTRKVTS